MLVLSSSISAETLASNVPLPTATVSDVSVTVTVDVPRTLPIAQFTMPPPSVQVPSDAAAETRETLVGSVKSATTLAASSVPTLTTSKVTVAVLPSSTADGELPVPKLMSTLGRGVMQLAFAISSAISSRLHCENVLEPLSVGSMR